MPDSKLLKDKKFYKKILKEMITIRRLEEKASQMYGLKKIGGFLHLYIGQEAIGVGAVAALDLTKDYVITAYRDHGHAISIGMDPNVIMAELYGKITGCSKGKGGSMHLFDHDKHFYGGHGIVGAHIPLAAGMALKIKYKKEDGVVLCFFGDGAIHQGSFHETLNIAKVWNLPVIYICENNQYGMGTFYKRVSSIEKFSEMGKSYEIESKQVNGMDVLEMYDEVKFAVEKVKKDSNPYFIEAKTYRYKGHSMSDPAKYRTKEELEEYKKQDPIIILKDKLFDNKIITEKEYEQIDNECIELSQKAAEFAEASEEPELNTLYEDVLAQ